MSLFSQASPYALIYFFTLLVFISFFLKNLTTIEKKASALFLIESFSFAFLFYHLVILIKESSENISSGGCFIVFVSFAVVMFAMNWNLYFGIYGILEEKSKIFAVQVIISILYTIEIFAWYFFVPKSISDFLANNLWYIDLLLLACLLYLYVSESKKSTQAYTAIV